MHLSSLSINKLFYYCKQCFKSILHNLSNNTSRLIFFTITFNMNEGAEKGGAESIKEIKNHSQCFQSYSLATVPHVFLVQQPLKPWQNKVLVLGCSCGFLFLFTVLPYGFFRMTKGFGLGLGFFIFGYSFTLWFRGFGL